MTTDLLPALDAAGLPGPPWLFHFLLVLTFFLHLIFMNLTLGGTLMAFVANLRSSGRADDAQSVLARRLMGVNTYAISAKIAGLSTAVCSASWCSRIAPACVGSSSSSSCCWNETSRAPGADCAGTSA